MEYWVWLSRIEKINNKTIEKLLSIYKTPKEIWKQTSKGLLNNGVEINQVQEIVNPKYRQNLESYVKYMKNHKIEIITRYDKD